MASGMFKGWSTVKTRSPFGDERARSPLLVFNYRVFLVPAILMLAGALVWVLGLMYWPENYALILLGELIFAIGLFVAIILGLWVMTLVRMPQW